jgi:regulatory protein
MDEIHTYALKLLARRDYSVAKLREKLTARFGEDASLETTIERLAARNFLNDRRFAESYAGRRRNRGRMLLQMELTARGIAPELAEDVLSGMEWPSLQEAVKATIMSLKLRAPLQTGDATRLFRALIRLGYEEEAVREVVEQLHEQ